MTKTISALLGMALLVGVSSVQAQSRGERAAFNRSAGSASAFRSNPAVRSQVLAGRNVRPAFARGRSSYNGSRYGSRYGSYHHHGGGRYYYLGGVPYFYPFYSVGFGYPSYYYGSAFGYGYEAPFYGGGAYPPGAYFGPEDQPYEGRIVEETTPENLRGKQPALSGNSSLPAAVQRQLAKRNYYKGSIDGQFGPASKEALRRFQRDNGLKQTGLIDEATLKSLGFAAR